MASLSLLEDTLNTSDRQNLFELHASVSSSKVGASGGPKGGGVDNRGNSRGEIQSTDLPLAQFDLDYGPGDAAQSNSKSTHVFAQVECIRDHLESETQPLTMSPEERLQRRLDEQSVVER